MMDRKRVGFMMKNLCIYAYISISVNFVLIPILYFWQPPPPVNDTNPYNVFRPREKAHRLHTRRVCTRIGCCVLFLAYLIV